MDELKEGEVVVLKSGGPPMTISQISGYMATCLWFDFVNPNWSDVHSEKFSVYSLVKHASCVKE